MITFLYRCICRCDRLTGTVCFIISTSNALVHFLPNSFLISNQVVLLFFFLLLPLILTLHFLCFSTCASLSCFSISLSIFSFLPFFFSFLSLSLSLSLFLSLSLYLSLSLVLVLFFLFLLLFLSSDPLHPCGKIVNI